MDIEVIHCTFIHFKNQFFNICILVFMFELIYLNIHNSQQQQQF